MPLRSEIGVQRMERGGSFESNRGQGVADMMMWELNLTRSSVVVYTGAKCEAFALAHLLLHRRGDTDIV